MPPVPRANTPLPSKRGKVMLRAASLVTWVSMSCGLAGSVRSSVASTMRPAKGWPAVKSEMPNSVALTSARLPSTAIPKACTVPGICRSRSSTMLRGSLISTTRTRPHARLRVAARGRAARDQHDGGRNLLDIPGHLVAAAGVQGANIEADVVVIDAVDIE